MNREYLRFWKLACKVRGYEYVDLRNAYDGLREIEKEFADEDQSIRINAYGLIFPQWAHIRFAWWKTLTHDLQKVVGDSDMTVIRGFDDISRILATNHPTLRADDPLATAQKVFEYLMSPRVVREDVEVVMSKAWKLAFGETAPSEEEVFPDLQEVPF
ncbi:hypothetical protein SH668x_001215 [Planctomicrobium sp. SH668]|uniref:hypothetical protein n=1 Tax=Planctomicrobium sp. SH668 TaxID=3448126 RepID=UPI003F5B3B54